MHLRLPIRSLLLMAVTVAAASATSASWLFKPVGTDSASDYSAAELDDTGWAPIRLPHREWDTIQPQDRVYGWYRRHIAVPAEYSSTDLVLKLGIVDDTDWTYFNGTLIGTTAAYNAERTYVVPQALLKPDGDNVIAVKVYDIIGTGGLLSEPRLGLRLTDGGQWLFRGGDPHDPAAWAAPDLDESEWQSITLPDEDWDGRLPADNVYGWYRLRFRLPEGVPSGGNTLDLGIINDADQAFVNGHPVGATGSLPPEFASAAGEPRLYPIREGLLHPGADNVLAVRVFNGLAKGGIQGEPALRLPTDEISGEGNPAARAWRLYREGKYKEACALALTRLSSTRVAAEGAECLNVLTAASQRQGRATDALKYFRQLTTEHENEIWSREAIQAVAEIQGSRDDRLAPEGAYLGQDRETQGDWWPGYGTGGFILFGALGSADLVGVPGSSFVCSGTALIPSADPPFPYHVSRCVAEEPDAYGWVWAWTTTDRRALLNPVIGTRTAVCADDKGEEHPFDGEGPDLRVTLDVPQGWWRLSAYLVDYDWWNTWHPRQHSLVLHDVSGAPLAVATTGKFGGGVWERFAVLGPRTVGLRICKGASINTVLSAACIDRPGAPIASPLRTSSRKLAPISRSYAAMQAEPGEPVAMGRRASELLTECDDLAETQALADKDRRVLEWMRWQLELTRDPNGPDSRVARDRFLDVLRELPARSQNAALAQHAEVLMDQQYLEPAVRLLEEVSTAWWCDAASREPARFAVLCSGWQTLDHAAAREVCAAGLEALGALPPDRRAAALLSMAEACRDQPALLVRGATLSALAWPGEFLPLPKSDPSVACAVYDALSRLPAGVGSGWDQGIRAVVAERARTLLDARVVTGWTDAEAQLPLSMIAIRLARVLGDPQLTADMVGHTSRLLWELGDRAAVIDVFRETEGAGLSIQGLEHLTGLGRDFDLPSDVTLPVLAFQLRTPSLTPSDLADLAVLTAGEHLRAGDDVAARETLAPVWEALTEKPDTAVAIPALLRLARVLGEVLIRAGDGPAVGELLDRLTNLRGRYQGAESAAIAREVGALGSRARAAGVM